MNENFQIKALQIFIVIILVGGAIYGVSSYSPTPSTPAVPSTPATHPSTPASSTPAPDSSAKLSIAEIVKEWSPRTALVYCFWESNSGQPYLTEQGSGLFTIDHLGTKNIPTIVTNKHVVDSTQYGQATMCSASIPGETELFVNTSLPEQNIPNGLYLDSTYDVAMIFDASYSGKLYDSYRACTPKEIETGDKIVILGYPDYGGIQPPFNPSPTVTEGIISGKDDIYYTTSAKMDPGNSGGVAIEEKNDCYIGIPTSSYIGEMDSLGRILPVSTFAPDITTIY